MGSIYCCLPYLPPSSTTIAPSIPSITSTFIPSSSFLTSISLSSLPSASTVKIFVPSLSSVASPLPQSPSTSPGPYPAPTPPADQPTTSTENDDDEPTDASDDDSDGPSGEGSSDDAGGTNVNLLTAILAAIGAGSLVLIASIGIVAWSQRKRRRQRGASSTAASVWGKDRRDGAIALESGLVPRRGDSVDSGASSTSGPEDNTFYRRPSSYVYSPSIVPRLPEFALQTSTTTTTSQRSILTIILPRPSLSIIESLSGAGSPTLVGLSVVGTQRTAMGKAQTGRTETSTKNQGRRIRAPGRVPAAPRRVINVESPIREQDEFVFEQHPYRSALPVSSQTHLHLGMTPRQASGLSHLFAAPVHSPSPSPVQGPEDRVESPLRQVQVTFAASAPSLTRPVFGTTAVGQLAASASPARREPSTEPPLASPTIAPGPSSPRPRPRPLGPFLLPFPTAPSSAPVSPMRPPRPLTMSLIDDDIDIAVPQTPPHLPTAPPHHISHPYRQESSSDSVTSLPEPRTRERMGRSEAGDVTSSWWSDDSGSPSERRDDSRRRSGREILAKLSGARDSMTSRRPWSGVGVPMGRAS